MATILPSLKIMLAICMFGLAWGRCAAGQVTAGEADERPNILFCISDDQSWEHASAYGYPAINTPSFDRIASEGVLFNNGFAPSPGCSPTRAAMLTGRHIWQIENAGTHASSFPTRYATYPDILADAGYFVGATGKLWSPGNSKGWDHNPAGPAYQERKLKPPYNGIGKTDYAANFADFLKARPRDQPFCFWYGANEPHRGFSKGMGLKEGKRLEDVRVPSFLPDTPEIRSDILDYCVEIEWFDRHLGMIVEQLDAIGELDNTLIIVTSDNGMAFPRAKANMYEYGFHEPLAVRWGNQVPGGRVVDDVVTFVDLTATILEAAGAEHPNPDLPLAGKSIMNILNSDKSGLVDLDREFIVAGRERHSSSRFNSLAYPQRAIRTQQFLYIRNFKPERWPAGAPQKYRAGDTSKGINEPEAIYLAEAREPEGLELEEMHSGYHDIDACPSLTFLVEHRDDPRFAHFFHLAVDKRPEEELFDIRKDPGCIHNLADDPAYADQKHELWTKLSRTLRDTGDPRMDGNDIFDSYRRYSGIRYFPIPDWATNGEVIHPNWAVYRSPEK